MQKRLFIKFIKDITANCKKMVLQMFPLNCCIFLYLRVDPDTDIICISWRKEKHIYKFNLESFSD